VSEVEDQGFWVDTIRRHEIVLTNGEFRLEFSVVSPDDTGSSLPEVFRKATISDQFEIDVKRDDE
jgi:hypothetical protein